MSESLYPSLREAQHHPDGLDIRLKETNSFISSIQNIKDIKIFHKYKLQTI